MPAVSPQILVWARESAGYDLAGAAKKLGIADTKNASAIEKLEAYEAGVNPPSRSLLVRMSKQYRRPLLTFYLNGPPVTGYRGEDYRTLSNDVDPSENALVDALVRDIKVRQGIVKDALISAQEREPLEFVDSFDIAEGANKLTTRIRETLEFDLATFRKQRQQGEAFGYLRSKIENIGVFTLLLGNLGSYHTNLSTDVFRGFALSDNIAPFLVVNDQDAKAAWSVTLLHEFAHIWLGRTGISGAKFNRTVEKFCNEVASEFLLPESELGSLFDFETLLEFEDSIISIDAFAGARKLSSRLVAYRLFRRKAINQKQFNALCEHFYERWIDKRRKQKAKARDDDRGPSYYVLKRHRVGTALVEASERLLRTGELSTTKAARVLGVRALKLEKMFSEANFG